MSWCNFWAHLDEMFWTALRIPRPGAFRLPFVHFPDEAHGWKKIVYWRGGEGAVTRIFLVKHVDRVCRQVQNLRCHSLPLWNAINWKVIIFSSLFLLEMKLGLYTISLKPRNSLNTSVTSVHPQPKSSKPLFQSKKSWHQCFRTSKASYWLNIYLGGRPSTQQGIVKP